jgi:ABC-type branched-subunit amino acid transport system ATPase component
VPEARLSVTELSKTFYGLQALNHVSFDVADGELLGIIGPNGAGKTTLVNCISGYLPATSGRIQLHGMRIEHLPIERRVERGVVRTFQHVRLFAQLNAIENVRLGAYAKRRYGISRALTGSYRGKDHAAKQAAASLLRQVELDRALWSRPVQALSPPQQRLVELARALAAEPDVLLLDEPTVGMTPTESERLSRWMASLTQADTAIILISHDMPFVMSHCDRVIVIDFGRVIANGSPAEVQADELVLEAYFGHAAANEGA